MSDVTRYDPPWEYEMNSGERGDYVRYTDYAALAARLADAEAENARLQTIAHRLAQCWMYGGWKAETKNEHDIEAAMRAIGWWPIPGETLIERENWVAARAPEARDA